MKIMLMFFFVFWISGTFCFLAGMGFQAYLTKRLQWRNVELWKEHTDGT